MARHTGLTREGSAVGDRAGELNMDWSNRLRESRAASAMEATRLGLRHNESCITMAAAAVPSGRNY